MSARCVFLIAILLAAIGCGKTETPPTTEKKSPSSGTVNSPPSAAAPKQTPAQPAEDPDETAALALYARWKEATSITVTAADSKAIRTGDETLRFQRTLEQGEAMKQRMSVVHADVQKQSPQVQEIFWSLVGWGIAGGRVQGPVLSGDGRHIVFEYDGVAYDATAEGKGKLVYLWDLAGGSVQRIVPDSAVGETGNFGRAAVSTNGAVAAFERLGNPSGHPKGFYNVAVVEAGKLTWPVDQTTLFPQTPWTIANDIVRVTRQPSLSADGKKLAFLAGQMASRSTDENVETFQILVLLDRQTGAFRALSGKAGSLHSPAISADGSTVAVVGPPMAFERGSKDGQAQALYLVDVKTSAAHRVPLPANTSWGTPDEIRMALSANGARVAFAVKTGAARQVHLYDRTTGQLTLISANAQGAPANGDSTEPAISADGGAVVFVSRASDLVAGTSWALYRFDVTSKSLVAMTVTADGRPAVGAVASPSLSADGTVVAFLSNARDLAGIRQTRLTQTGTPQMRLYAGRIAEKRFVALGARL